MDNFTSMEYLLSFPGMIVAVIMLTQWTKSLFDKWITNKTKYIVFAYSLTFCIIASAFQGKFTSGQAILETCLVWAMNSVIVWFAAMKAYESISAKFTAKGE